MTDEAYYLQSDGRFVAGPPPAPKEVKKKTNKLLITIWLVSLIVFFGLGFFVAPAKNLNYSQYVANRMQAGCLPRYAGVVAQPDEAAGLKTQSEEAIQVLKNEGKVNFEYTEMQATNELKSKIEGATAVAVLTYEDCLK